MKALSHMPVMHRRAGFTLVELAIAGALLLASCAPAQREAAHEDEQGHHDEAIERGPHGGRLLRSGDLALELSIEEAGIPPEFRAHLHDGKIEFVDAAQGTHVRVILPIAV